MYKSASAPDDKRRASALARRMLTKWAMAMKDGSDSMWVSTTHFPLKGGLVKEATSPSPPRNLWASLLPALALSNLRPQPREHRLPGSTAKPRLQSAALLSFRDSLADQLPTNCKMQANGFHAGFRFQYRALRKVKNKIAETRRGFTKHFLVLNQARVTGSFRSTNRRRRFKSIAYCTPMAAVFGHWCSTVGCDCGEGHSVCCRFSRSNSTMPRNDWMCSTFGPLCKRKGQLKATLHRAHSFCMLFGIPVSPCPYLSNSSCKAWMY